MKNIVLLTAVAALVLAGCSSTKLGWEMNENQVKAKAFHDYCAKGNNKAQDAECASVYGPYL